MQKQCIKADIILSLGSACHTAHHLRKNHLRLFSSPLDWMVSGDLDIIYDLFCNDFKDFFLNYEIVKHSKKAIRQMSQFMLKISNMIFYPFIISLLMKI